jgi:general secretion pathway protein G
MVLVLVVGAVFVPRYVQAVRRAKEAVLAEDLSVVRGAAAAFTKDNKKQPEGVAELVETGYLKEVPINPMDHRRFTTW